MSVELCDFGHKMPLMAQSRILVAFSDNSYIVKEVEHSMITTFFLQMPGRIFCAQSNWHFFFQLLQLLSTHPLNLSDDFCQ